MERNSRKVKTGTVIGQKSAKTIKVAVLSSVKHPIYGKIRHYLRKYIVHDEQNSAHVGDKVQIMETRKISKTKNWRLVKIVDSNITNESEKA